MTEEEKEGEATRSENIFRRRRGNEGSIPRWYMELLPVGADLESNPVNTGNDGQLPPLRRGGRNDVLFGSHSVIFFILALSLRRFLSSRVLAPPRRLTPDPHSLSMSQALASRPLTILMAD